jgi:hypothetical protein
MYYISSLLGLWFLLIGFAFIYISTQVNDSQNKLNFLSCGSMCVIVGGFPMIMGQYE